MIPRFEWFCSFMGTADFRVTDHTGSYEASLRRSVDSYELSIANGDDVRSEMKSGVGIFRRSHCVRLPDGSYDFEVPPETVDAFNEWRMQQHLAFMHRLDTQPERYGIVTTHDPLRGPPPMARGGRYVIGEHRWEITHSLGV